MKLIIDTNINNEQKILKCLGFGGYAASYKNPNLCTTVIETNDDDEKPYFLKIIKGLVNNNISFKFKQ